MELQLQLMISKAIQDALPLALQQALLHPDFIQHLQATAPPTDRKRKVLTDDDETIIAPDTAPKTAPVNAPKTAPVNAPKTAPVNAPKTAPVNAPKKVKPNPAPETAPAPEHAPAEHNPPKEKEPSVDYSPFHNSFPLAPFDGTHNPKNCSALTKSDGLYLQCTIPKKNGSDTCGNAAHKTFNFGKIQDRIALKDAFLDPHGKTPITFATYCQAKLFNLDLAARYLHDHLGHQLAPAQRLLSNKPKKVKPAAPAPPITNTNTNTNTNSALNFTPDPNYDLHKPAPTPAPALNKNKTPKEPSKNTAPPPPPPVRRTKLTTASNATDSILALAPIIAKQPFAISHNKLHPKPSNNTFDHELLSELDSDSDDEPQPTLAPENDAHDAPDDEQDDDAPEDDLKDDDDPQDDDPQDDPQDDDDEDSQVYRPLFRKKN